MSKLPPLKSGFGKNLDQPADEFAFYRVFVDQLKTSRTSILDKIRKDICVLVYTDIRIDNLLAKHLVLETVCCRLIKKKNAQRYFLSPILNFQSYDLHKTFQTAQLSCEELHKGLRGFTCSLSKINIYNNFTKLLGS